MKAVRIHEYGGPEKLIFEDGVAEPQLAPDSVLIETAAASVNPIDWKIRSGARQKDFPLSLPAILGTDTSGVVREVGREVRDFVPGQRVLARASATYAQFVVLQGSLVTHLPDGLDLADAAAIPLAALTGDQLVRRATTVSKGQTLLVSGALGSVGRAALHTAKKMGVRVIAGVRRAQLAEAGALEPAGVVAIDDEDAIGRLAAVDAVADTVGGEVALQLLARVRPGGTFGYASVLPDRAAAAHPMVRITRVFAKPDPSKVREFADDVRDGRFMLAIGLRLPLRDAVRAHTAAEQGGAGKILLTTRDA